MDAFLCYLKVFLGQFYPNEIAFSIDASYTRLAAAHSHIQYRLPFVGICLYKPFQQAHGFTRGVVEVLMFLFKTQYCSWKFLIGDYRRSLRKTAVTAILAVLKAGIARLAAFVIYGTVSHLRIIGGLLAVEHKYVFVDSQWATISV